jgi:Tfp pilus assembly protein PilF
MKKENLVFLAGGLAFGFLIGFGVYHTVGTQPRLDGATTGMTGAAPAGPPAPGQTGGGAPMVAEINELKRLLQNDPDNFQALVRLGNLHYDVRMWEQAAGYYERAVEVEPGNADVRTDLGVCYRNMGRFDEALNAFTAAHKADPQHFQSLFNIVVVAGIDLGEYEVADEAMRVLEAMDPPPPRLDELRAALESARTQRAAGGEEAS